jgi:hypothetical protein
MPSVSRSTAPRVEDFGPAVDHSGELAGYTVNFVSLRQDADLGLMLQALPGGQCPCPHWGFLMKGRLTVRYSEGEETIRAGEAFYLPPGHVPAATAGTEFVQFSPAAELAAVMAVVQGAASGSEPETKRLSQQPRD